jgi:hypothetical protein
MAIRFFLVPLFIAAHTSFAASVDSLQSPAPQVSPETLSALPGVKATEYKVPPDLLRSLKKCDRFATWGTVAHFVGCGLLFASTFDSKNAQPLILSGWALAIGGPMMSWQGVKDLEHSLRQNGITPPAQHGSRDLLIAGAGFGLGIVPGAICLVLSFDSREKAKPYFIGMMACWTVGEAAVIYSNLEALIFTHKCKKIIANGVPVP